jgi:hypothetical protein
VTGVLASSVTVLLGVGKMSDEKPETPIAKVYDDDLESLIDTSTLDNSYHYRFVHERPQRQARIRAQGYAPVLASADGVKTLVEGIVGADDIIRNGDCILMACPLERFQARRERVNTLNRSRLAAPRAQFRKKTERAGPGGKDVRVVTEDSTDKG